MRVEFTFVCLQLRAFEACRCQLAIGGVRPPGSSGELPGGGDDDDEMR